MKHIQFLALAGLLMLAVNIGSSQTFGAIAQQAYLKASAAKEEDRFGSSVAISGDTMVVGAPTVSGNDGAAYVFVRTVTPTGTKWIPQADLKPLDIREAYAFGTSVAISANTVVVGSPGSTYVFVRTGTTWSQQTILREPNTGNFGISVSVWGDTAVVGADRDASNGQDSGAAYVFVRSGTAWTQQAKLKASNADPGDRFGVSVGVSGDTVVVGAYGEQGNATGVNGSEGNGGLSSLESGAAYVFVRSGTTWTQQAYLKASNTGGSDVFGKSVAVSGDTVVVGAQLESSNATGVNGDQANNNASGAGAAYVFFRSGKAWSQQAYLKASNTEQRDFFGYSVAAEGDTVVVGAREEDSNASGQGDNSAFNSGAAYVFTRSGTTWSQRAYLKASNPEGGKDEFESGDSFGCSVAISSSTIVVGAQGEDSKATGADGNQSDNSTFDSGAAYVFTLGGSGPSTGPEIVVEQPAGTPLTDGTATVDFGIVYLRPDSSDGRSSVLVFTIKNTGDADLTGVGITVDGLNATEFRVGRLSLGAEVLPGRSFLFSVEFTPTDVRLADWSATLHLVSNDSDENPFDIALIGQSRRPFDCSGRACSLEWFYYCYSSGLTGAIQPMQMSAPASLSLGHFYALQSLMNQTAEGRRLTGLYWQHTREIVLIAIANPALALEARQVLLDFQPAVSALLSGNGSSVQITQAMIDQLNRAWTGFANVGSPALKTALETERARFNGFQTFAGKNFSEWATILQVPVPAQPYIEAFNPTKQQDRFSVAANYILGLAYSLWKSANPGSAAWAQVLDASVQLNADGVELTDTNASPSALFYKVRAQQTGSGQ